MENPVAGTGSPRKRGTQPVVAAAAADRAEADGTALFVLGFEGEFDLVDGAGVVFEAADNRLIDPDPVTTISGVLTKFFISRSSCAAFLEASIDSQLVPLPGHCEKYVARGGIFQSAQLVQRIREADWRSRYPDPPPW